MASACYDQWRLYENDRGAQKWVNEGAAPDGACPSCPEQSFPEAGAWDGVNAACSGGAIKKMVADGNGGIMIGAVIAQVNSARAKAACNGDYYVGTGPISNYF